MYDTDITIGEVWQLNFYYGIEISKPNKIRNVNPVRGRTGNVTIQKWKIYYIKIKVIALIINFRWNKYKSEMISFKSNENIHKKEGGSYYVVSIWNR